MTPVRGAWVTHPSPRAAPALRLFTFAHCGAGTRPFQLWPAGLPEAVEVCPVLLPGREARADEPLLTTIPEIADRAALAIAPELDLPCVLFGHSLGALLAFEVARRLGEAGHHARLLVVSACAAPDEAAPALRPAIHELDDDAFLEAVAGFGALPEELRTDGEMRAAMLPALRADFAAVEGYAFTAGARLPVPITAIGGTEDATVSRAALEAWRRQTSRRFSLSLQPGGHFYPARSRTTLLRMLAREILAVDPSAGG